MQTPLQEQRRQVKMARRREVVNVQILNRHIEHDPRVGQNPPRPPVRQQDGHARFFTLRAFRATREIDPAPGEPLHRNRAHRVGTIHGHETHALTQNRQVVSKDGGGASQGHLEVRGQDFAVERNRLSETVEDQIQVDLAGNCDIELSHRCCEQA